jgi:D-alanyl-D-alanine carboxypeptidase/D-alanyl-D-alanine-endopeptidase (penicillin-binding protein 4)
MRNSQEGQSTIWTLLTISFIALIFSNCFATTLNKLKKDLDALINKYDPNINIGIEVQDLTTNHLVYQKNADRFFVPASNLKLLTDAAALMYLGADFRLQSTIYTNAKLIKNGVLQGNLYFHFSGAPDLTYHDLVKSFKKIASMGIKSLSGSIVLVGNDVTEEGFGPGWMVDDIRHSYGAPVSPFIVNQNRLDILINPGSKVNQTAFITFEEPSNSIQLINKVITVADPKLCKIKMNFDVKHRLLIEGCIGVKGAALERDVAIIQTEKYAKDNIQAALNEAGIKFHGAIKVGSHSVNRKRLDRIPSANMANLLKQTLKPSDNLFADSVFLKLGQLFYKEKSNWRTAAKAVKNILSKYAGIDLRKAAIFDGSGLSRYNLITPHQLTSLLAFLNQQFAISYEFMSALPVAGRDGTLRNRFIKGEQRAMVRAKTGSMLGVVSLAGYLPSKNNHLLAFSMMINNISGQNSRSLYKYRVLEDKICDYLMKASLWRKLLNAPNPKSRQLPFQSRASQEQKNKIRENRLRNLEWALRKHLNSASNSIVRSADGIKLSVFNVKQKSTSAIKKEIIALKQVLTKRKTFAWIKTADPRFMALLNQYLPGDFFIVQLLPASKKGNTTNGKDTIWFAK